MIGPQDMIEQNAEAATKRATDGVLGPMALSEKRFGENNLGNCLSPCCRLTYGEFRKK
jgi:hypothetical protein